MLHRAPVLHRRPSGTPIDDDTGLLAVSYPERVFRGPLEATDRDPRLEKRPRELHRASRLPGRGAGTDGVQRVAGLPGRASSRTKRLDRSAGRGE